MGLIPQNFIDDLVARADIVEIINARVPLKRKGKEYMACCPFHNEKTPSFTVSETKQFYHCFGCGAHGTALGFLMEYDNLEFVEAVEELAQMYHLEVPREQGSSRTQDDREPLFEIMEEVNRLYKQQLKSDERAIDYLKNRGLTGEIARRYQIGYAPDGWDFLSARYSDEQEKTSALTRTGMLVQKDKGGHYDRFRDRIMFAITNRRGRVIGFGGRILDSGEPKYLNSPENALFHKGQEVYGLYEAKRATRDLKRLVVVEGYMDVVALAQFDISYAVACLGTATTKEQIQLLLRTCPEIVFCYDGDNAGRKAAWRACQNTLEVIKDGQHARFLFLPDGEDPDTLVRSEGREAFENRLSDATSLSDFLFEQLAVLHDPASLEGKAKLAEAARPMLARMSESLFRDLLTQRLADVTDISVDRLITQASPSTPTHTKQKAAPRRNSSTPKGLRHAIALLVQYPELAHQVDLDQAVHDCDTQSIALFSAIHRIASDNPQMTSAALLERFRDDEAFESLKKMQHYDVPGIHDNDTRLAVFRDAINQVVRFVRSDDHAGRLSELESKVREQGLGALSDAEKQEYNDLITKNR